MLHIVACLACLVGMVPTAAEVSYVVVNARGENSIVRVSSDGHSFQLIANLQDPSAIAVDRDGNYLVATDTPRPGADSALFRVTPGGVITKIVESEPGSSWIALTVDPAGNVLLVDNRNHGIWKVPLGGTRAEWVCSFPISAPEVMDEGGILAEGDVLVCTDLARSRFFD